MIYQYECKHGHGRFDVLKHHNRSRVSERCPKCKGESHKVFSTPYVGMGTFKPGYYHSFGKTFRSRHELNNEIRKINGETGENIVEVGNDNRRIKPEVKKPDIESAVRELKKKWRS